MIAKDPKAGEPRFQINDSITGQLIFGVDVDGLKPGASVTVDGSALGFPLESINDIPGGTYSVQALIHKYETFKRSDGHTVKLPMDRGEGQQWARAPGNLYSTPQTVSFDPKQGWHGLDRARQGDRAAADSRKTRSTSNTRAS